MVDETLREDSSDPVQEKSELDQNDADGSLRDSDNELEDDERYHASDGEVDDDGRCRASDDDEPEDEDGFPSSDTESDDDADSFAAQRGSVRPAVARPLRRNPAGSHARPQDSAPSFNGEIPGLGISMRTLALLVAVVVAVSLIVALIVAFATLGAVQGSLSAQQREFQTSMQEQFDQQKAEISSMQDELKEQVDALTTAQEDNADVAQAKQSLQEVIGEANAWLESGDGRWVSDRTEKQMKDAISTARRLIDESGISDAQIIQNAKSTIEDIIEGVDEGSLW